MLFKPFEGLMVYLALELTYQNCSCNPCKEIIFYDEELNYSNYSSFFSLNNYRIEDNISAFNSVNSSSANQSFTRVLDALSSIQLNSFKLSLTNESITDLNQTTTEQDTIENTDLDLNCSLVNITKTLLTKYNLNIDCMVIDPLGMVFGNYFPINFKLE